MITLIETQTMLGDLRREFAKWKRDTVVRPVRDPTPPSGPLGQQGFAVVRSIGAGTEDFIMVQRLREIAAAPGWVYASATQEKVKTYGGMVSAEYKPFVTGVDPWVATERAPVIPLVRSNLMWIAVPFTAPEMIDIDDLDDVPRTDGYPPVGGLGAGTGIPAGGASGAAPAGIVDDLADADIDGTPADNEIFAWDTATGMWTNQTLAEVGVVAAAIAAVQGEQTLDLTGDVTIATGKSLAVDTLLESAAAAGVTIEGVLLKDGSMRLGDENAFVYGTDLDGSLKWQNGPQRLLLTVQTVQRIRWKGTGSPATQIFGDVQIDQSDNALAEPVLQLDQANTSEALLAVIGTSDVPTNTGFTLADVADWTTPGALAGWLKVHVTDTRGSGLTDGFYYIPFHFEPTA